MAKLQGLQGHNPAPYKRGLRKGDYELHFGFTEIWYRPFWQTTENDRSFLFVEARSYSGGDISLPAYPPLSIEEEIENGDIMRGPAQVRGKMDLSGILHGKIVRVLAKPDPVTGLRLSKPNTLEAGFIVESDKTSEVDVFTTLPGEKKLRIKKGKEYRYTLYELDPDGWKILGPFEIKASNVIGINRPVEAMSKEDQEAVANMGDFVVAPAAEAPKPEKVST